MKEVFVAVSLAPSDALVCDSVSLFWTPHPRDAALAPSPSLEPVIPKFLFRPLLEEHLVLRQHSHDSVLKFGFTLMHSLPRYFGPLPCPENFFKKASLNLDLVEETENEDVYESFLLAEDCLRSLNLSPMLEPGEQERLLFPDRLCRLPQGDDVLGLPAASYRL